MANSPTRCGFPRVSLGNLQQALTYFEKDLELTKQLYDSFPNNVSFKNGLALSYQWLGWFYETKLNDKSKANENYHSSKTLLEQLVNSFPMYVEFKKNLAWVEEKLAEK